MINKAADTTLTITLTTSIDSLTGTANNDTFVAVQTGGTDETWGAADTVDGSGGVDTLNITHTEAATALNVGTVKNIENVVLRVAVDQATDLADAVDMDNLSGVTSLTLDRTVGRNDVTDVALTTGVTFLDSSADMDTTVTYKASGVTGSSDAATVTLNGVTAGADIELAGDVETVTIATTGASSSLADLDLDAQTKTVNINADEALTVASTWNATGATKLVTTGDSLVTITPALAAATVTVDASAQTAGGTRVILGGNAEFKGGAGNDRVDTTANTTKDVTGGAGTDTVVFTASTNYATSAANVSGFEVLRGSGIGSSYNAATITGLTGVEAEATAGALAFTGLGASTPVTVIGDTTALTLTLADSSGSSDVLNVTLDNDASTATAVTVGALTSGAVETFNIVSGDALASGTANVISALTGSTAVKTINVSGTSDLTITNASAATALTSIDASGFSKILTVTGAVAGSTIKGGSGDDSFSTAFGNLGSTTGFVGGAGDDTLTVSGAAFDIVDGDFAAVSGIENLVITGSDGTATLQGFAQAAIQSIDGNSDGRLDITAANLTDASTIDASALVNAGVDIVFTTVSAAADANVVYGGALNDTITYTQTGAFNTTGDIRGGNGIDTITVSSNALGIETVLSTATSLANSDIVTGLTTGVDKYDYNGTLTNAAATAGTGATLAAAIAAQAAAGTYVVSTDIADSGSNSSGSAMAAVLASTADNLATNYAAFEAQLLGTGGILASTITGLDAEATAGESFLLSVDNGTGSIVMRVVNTTDTGNTITADEIDLVGVFTGTLMAAGDFI